ncbi:MAG: LysR family transcriptional regulator [Rhizobacter sp.]|nr:LysR family transcriptional regulator [Rhizobacter sp.]
MDSEALETFLAVHRRGGVSAAALALSRTQSAISRRLALLERDVGVPLFERIGRGLVLSEAGAALLPHAERVAAAVGDARAAVEAVTSGAAGVVRMVAVGTLANAALAQALRRAKAAHPGLDVRLQTATSAEVSAQVRAGDAVIGLRYFDDPAPDLDCRAVQTEKLVVACAPSHRLAGKRVKTLAQLADERWLAFPVQERRSEIFAASVVAQFLSRGIDRIDWVAIDGLTAQKRLVEAGFGLALLQAGAVADELARREIATIRVDDLRLEVPVTRVVRRGGFLSGGARAVLKALDRGAGRAG